MASFLLASGAVLTTNSAAEAKRPANQCGLCDETGTGGTNHRFGWGASYSCGQGGCHQNTVEGYCHTFHTACAES